MHSTSNASPEPWPDASQLKLRHWVPQSQLNHIFIRWDTDKSAQSHSDRAPRAAVRASVAFGYAMTLY